MPGILQIRRIVVPGAVNVGRLRGRAGTGEVDLVSQRVQDWDYRLHRSERRPCRGEQSIVDDQGVERQLAAGLEQIRLVAALLIEQESRLEGVLVHRLRDTLPANCESADFFRRVGLYSIELSSGKRIETWRGGAMVQDVQTRCWTTPKERRLVNVSLKVW